MPINIELLERVRDHILEEPRRYRQGAHAEIVPIDVSPCGTRACIGGWADILEGNDVKNIYFDVDLNRAARKLGFTNGQAYKVFYGYWPSQFDGAVWSNDLPREDAVRITADYINYIIRTGDVF